MKNYIFIITICSIIFSCTTPNVQEQSQSLFPNYTSLIYESIEEQAKDKLDDLNKQLVQVDSYFLLTNQQRKILLPLIKEMLEELDATNRYGIKTQRRRLEVRQKIQDSWDKKIDELLTPQQAKARQSFKRRNTFL